MPSLREWVRYARWNAALAEVFFAGRFAGQPVYLDLEDDHLSILESMLEVDAGNAAADLTTAVVATLGLTEGEPMFGVHARRFRRWRREQADSPPPVIAVLAFQSLVAERMRGDEDFHPSNYYGRFMQMAGLDPRDDRMRTKVVQSFRVHSPEFWSGLNAWLSRDVSTRGIPTAYSFDYRVHVGIPMSQALVRASDREAIHRLFADLGLQPGQAMAVEDMIRLLGAWLPSSHVSTGLRRLCHDAAALRRVAEVSCLELHEWSGLPRSGTIARRSMAISATLRQLGNPRLRLSLSTRVPAGVAELRLDPSADDAARLATAESDGILTLGAPDDDGWSAVTSPFGMADVLVSRLRAQSDGCFTTRDPRAVIVLARSVNGGYRETERVRLGASHLLLVSRALSTYVEEELRKVARPHPRRHDTLRGLPDEWVLFSGVEIVGISESNRPDLSVLIPLAWTDITIDGGLQLPDRRTWHVTAPPEIRASAPAGRKVAIELLHETEAPHESSAADGVDPSAGEPAMTSEPLLVQLFEEVAIVDLAEFELDDGDYRIRLFDDSTRDGALGTATFHLRSSDSATPVKSPLAYVLGLPLGAISAIQGATDEGIRGAVIVEAAVPLHQVELAEAAPASLAPTDPSPEDSDEEWDQAHSLPQRRSMVPDCVLSGAHHFVDDKRPPRQNGWHQPFDGVCRHCLLEKHIVPRPKRHRRHGAHARITDADKRVLPAVRQEPSVDHDLILDALCATGCGTFDVFERLVQAAEHRPWTARELLRRLVSLGHIDIGLNDDARPARWSVSPPSLVSRPDGAFLSGWRSPTMLSALGRTAARLGGTSTWESQPDGPARIAVAGLDQSQLQELAAEVAAASGRSFNVIEDPAIPLARALQPLASIRNSLRSLQSVPANATLERLDPQSLQWEPASTCRPRGAYRFGRTPRTVVHSDGVDLRICDVRVAKWLSADRTLVAYDRAERLLYCHVGSEPPGLFERALVLCSGRLPERREGHLAAYVDVPEHVAMNIIARLRQTEWSFV